MIPRTIVHLLSGGLDSVTLLYDLVGRGERVHCVLFDYGQRHVQELVFAKAHCKRLSILYTTITIPQLIGSTLTDGTSESFVVPFRNPVMVAHAVNLAVGSGADTVTIGCNADDRDDFPDCRWEVFDAINHAIKISGYNVEVAAPYLSLRKWQILDLAKTFGVPNHEVWWCYR